MERELIDIIKISQEGYTLLWIIRHGEWQCLSFAMT